MIAQRPSLNDRLAEALPWHFKQGRPYREHRKELLTDWAGRTTYPAYKDRLYLGIGDDQPGKQIVNLTMQAAEAFVMNLAADRPRFSCTSRYVEYEVLAERLTRALDRYAEDLHLEENLQDICRDSFALFGVAKICQVSSAAVGLEVDWRMDPGRPYVQRVSPDRLVWDTTATSLADLQFIGDYYSIPFEQAIRSPRFSRRARARMREDGPEDWTTDSDRGEDLAKAQNDHPIHDVLFFVDVFVRRPVRINGVSYASQVRTYCCNRNLELRNPEPVQVVGWEGAESGPYEILNMGPVPDHFMPSSPGQNQMLLCQLVNTLYRKLETQCRRQKNLGTGTREDIERAMNAKDGEWVEFQNPEMVVIHRMDGPDQNIMGAAHWFNELHSQASMNLKHKLGLSQSADTASQERMIGAMVSRLEAFYQQRYVSFVRRVAKGLSKLLYFDTNLTVPGTWETPGGYVVNDFWPKYGAAMNEEEKGDGRSAEDYKYCRVDIDPYSMGYKSPGERAAFIDAQMTKWLPAVPFLAQMGVQPDLPAYMELMAKYSGISELRKVFRVNQAPMEMGGGGGESIGSMGGPNGQYEHTSRSTRSPESEAMQYFQSAQGQGSAA